MKDVILLFTALLLAPLAALHAVEDVPIVAAVRWDGWYGDGGWLQPTLGADGKLDDGRIKALGKVLRPSALPKP